MYRFQAKGGSALHKLYRTDRLYAACNSLQLQVHKVGWAALREYSNWIRKFERAAKHYGEDPVVRGVLSGLKRFGFRYCYSPLPISHSYLSSAPAENCISDFMSVASAGYPDLYEMMTPLSEIIGQLKNTEENPLLRKIIHLVSGRYGSSVAVLVLSSAIVSELQSVLDQHCQGVPTAVISKWQLKNPDVHDNLLIVGAPHWYPEHIIDAPRSPNIDIVVFEWIKVALNLREHFEEQLGVVHEPIRSVSSTQQIATDADQTSVIDLVMPSIDWSSISDRVRDNIETPDRADVKVNALLVKLAGDLYTSFLYSSSARVLVVDTTTSGEALDLVYRDVSEIEAGDLVVLRTEGGSDLLVPIANRLLGKSANELRERQERWKAKISGKVQQSDLDTVVRRLRQLGGKRANANNVRNWMSLNNHRPQDYSDFLAIMRLIGEENKARLYWDGARSLERAHRKAGFVIRKLLLEQVRNADIISLQRTGRADFSLDYEGSGTISVIRIEAVSPNVFEVPEYRIGQVFKEESSWLG